ncbi:Ig-like domain-containing protein [Salinicoccus hispanicus]|uniref:Bacterial Ig domain-containing protein n=1 Tax=Salinicoccus hispanicus TaxID=157225 RepID=A0A6N8U285_9STAP|nr:Ig-like domain-containing protein [Salinicoccus hispanicus]MXQ51076.1 hypothetical protein [Salinicoccus hispanicus]
MRHKNCCNRYLFVVLLVWFSIFSIDSKNYVYGETENSAEDATEIKDINPRPEEEHIDENELDQTESGEVSIEGVPNMEQENEQSSGAVDQQEADVDDSQEVIEESSEVPDTDLAVPEEETEEVTSEELTEEEEQDVVFQPFQVQDPGLLDLRLLTNTTLNAQRSTVNGKERITLTYRGDSILNLGLVSNAYAIFSLPPEIMNTITKSNLTASYNVPGLVSRNRGNFTTQQIQIEGNQVYMEVRNLLTLGLLSYYTYTLNIDLEELPLTDTGEYRFYSEATRQLVDLSVISGNPATTTLAAPTRPEAPIFDDPVYATDTVVTGTGAPNTTIRLEISGDTYEAQVDRTGDFTVSVPSLEVGSEIVGRIIDASGYESAETRIVVLEAPDTTPPEQPIVNPVYSNKTTVEGNGEPGTTVLVKIEGQEYEGSVDSEGNFSVSIPSQAPDTVITVELVDEAGNVSPSAEVTVIEATIAFQTVPGRIAFETTSIESISARIPRADTNWSLEVIDTRGAGSPFTIMAEATELRASDGMHTISDGLVYVDSASNSQSLNNEPVEVYSGQTGNDPISEINWPENEGPLVEVSPGDVRVGTYGATITWTIVDAP